MNEITAQRFLLNETRTAMTFVDVLENGEIILHEMYSDGDLPQSPDPNKKYNYHVVFSLRGNNAHKLRDVLNMYLSKTLEVDTEENKSTFYDARNKELR